MKRNAKALQQKAMSLKDKVTPRNDGTYAVPSGTDPDVTYSVREHANGFWSCTCEWGYYHWRSGRPCSHIEAAQMWLAEAGNRRLSLWASEEDAGRQRKPVERVGPNLWATSRRLATCKSLRVTAATAMANLYD